MILGFQDFTTQEERMQDFGAQAEPQTPTQRQTQVRIRGHVSQLSDFHKLA